jgi:hypothetical protein
LYNSLNRFGICGFAVPHMRKNTKSPLTGLIGINLEMVISEKQTLS